MVQHQIVPVRVLEQRHPAHAGVERLAVERHAFRLELSPRGLSEAEASALIVSGFVEPITKELPLEYAVEMNRLIQLQMEGSVG